MLEKRAKTLNRNAKLLGEVKNGPEKRKIIEMIQEWFRKLMHGYYPSNTTISRGSSEGSSHVGAYPCLLEPTLMLASLISSAHHQSLVMCPNNALT